MKIKEFLKQYIGLLKDIADYKEPSDYKISCSNNSIYLEIKNEELITRIGTNTIQLEKLHEERITCLVSRILNITETSKYVKELKTIAVISKILEFTNNVKTFIVLDDISPDIILTAYYFGKIKNKIENITPEKIIEISIYIKYLQLLKNILSHVKDLQKQLRYIHDPHKEEEYRIKLSRLDNLMPTISKLWENNRELFDKIHYIINKDEKTDEEIIRETLNNHEYLAKLVLIRNFWKKYIENIIDKQIKYTIIFLSEITPVSTELKELDIKLNYLLKYLRDTYLCEEIIFLDGEEYSILQKYTGLEFDTINIQ